MASQQVNPAQRVGFFRSVWRALRQLFHETTGAMFFLLAFSWASAAVRNWLQKSAPWLWALCASLALVFVMFGWTSFRSARRVR
jgi:hypothetical protein